MAQERGGLRGPDVEAPAIAGLFYVLRRHRSDFIAGRGKSAEQRPDRRRDSAIQGKAVLASDRRRELRAEPRPREMASARQHGPRKDE